MNMNPVHLSAASAVLALALCACSGDSKQPVKPAKPPETKAEAIKKPELLTPPTSGTVMATKEKAADYPALKVATIKAGEGEDTLEMGEMASFHLVYKSAAGKELRSTRSIGQPDDILMMEWGDVKGLVLGVLGMKKGEIRNLRIPPELGYGEAGAPMFGLPANATLFVRVELVEFKSVPEGFQAFRTAEGTGVPLTRGQRGNFWYTGIFAEGDRAGEQFDSNRKPDGTPFGMNVGLSGAIEGWLKGGMGMRVGEKRWLRIPAKWAYGDRGQGEIPPNSDLIFEMELVSK